MAITTNTELTVFVQFMFGPNICTIFVRSMCIMFICNQTLKPKYIISLYIFVVNVNYNVKNFKLITLFLRNLNLESVALEV